jgi:ATP-dependent helicase STH1/SNF2
VGCSHQALEEGEDIQQLSEQARLKQARRVAKLESGSGTPMSESGRGRGRKGKAKINEVDFEPANGKRKRGMNNKSMSVTPSAMDDDEEDRDMVCQFVFDQKLFF